MKKFKKRDEVFVLAPKVTLQGSVITDLERHDKHIQEKIWYISDYTKSQMGWQYELTNIENDDDCFAWVYEKQLIGIEEAINRGIITFEVTDGENDG